MKKVDEQINAILKVIEAESIAFWKKDYDAWAGHWVHASYIRFMGWYPGGGISYTEGWNALSDRIKQHLANDPTPNPNAAMVRRENINVRIIGDSAWVTFDQYGVDSGQPTYDMPGRSRETRILEKQEEVWKIVYVNYLLEGSNE
jgi:hypothetical protein